MLGCPFASALLSSPSAVSVNEHLSAFFARQCVQKEDAGTTNTAKLVHLRNSITHRPAVNLRAEVHDSNRGQLAFMDYHRSDVRRDLDPISVLRASDHQSFHHNITTFF